MGWWRTGKDGSSMHAGDAGLVWGDGPADILDDAIGKIRAEFREAYEREPSRAELESGLQFSLGALEEPGETSRPSRKSQSGSAKALTAALDALRPGGSRRPVRCPDARGPVRAMPEPPAYLLDTAPYSGREAEQIRVSCAPWARPTRAIPGRTGQTGTFQDQGARMSGCSQTRTATSPTRRRPPCTP